MARRAIWQAVLGVAIVCAASLFFLLATADTPFYKSASVVSEHNSKLKAKPLSKFYEFDTASQFLLGSAAASNRSKQELCLSFPRNLLRDIQPVLKTGHGVINTRVQNSLDSCSACLDNLLILSDSDEEFDGRSVFDVIGDLSPLQLEQEQLASYNALKNGTASASTLSRGDAWRLDKFKFLLGISRAWRMRPERRWYVFYEGDTFVVWDNVFRFLENFDPDTTHYFGSPSPGRHTKGNKVTWFANGGPGYILSRAAMKKLIKNDWDADTGVYLGSKLTEKHWENLLGDCCGDSVLGWALWEAKVPLEGIWPSMNPHPVHGVPFSDIHWCQPVISMHKLHEKDMLDLWHWEWTTRKRHRPLLYRDLALSFLDLTNMTTRQDWDNGDWDAFPPPPEDKDAHASIKTCESSCQAHDRCFQWTYHHRTCWFVRSFRLGGSKQPSTNKENEEWNADERKFVAGWDTAKIQKWAEKRNCEVVEWVRPSNDRIL